MNLTKYYIYKRSLTNPFIYGALWGVSYQFEIVIGSSFITRTILKESGINMQVDGDSTITRTVNINTSFAFNITCDSSLTRSISANSIITTQSSGESKIYE